jgi:hypothetical protein
MPISGQVFVKLPVGVALYSLLTHPQDTPATRAAAPVNDPGFVPLTEARQLPVGTQVDARTGALQLVAAAANGSSTSSGVFQTGIFEILQARSGKLRGLTTLRLLDGTVPGAPTYQQCKATSRQRKGRAPTRLSTSVLQLLRADVHGRFQTIGHYSAATVRGTQWDTEDRCDGTLTTVHRGTVIVTNSGHTKTARLTQGLHALVGFGFFRVENCPPHQRSCKPATVYG